jgi:aspartyl aminopeptidase
VPKCLKLLILYNESKHNTLAYQGKANQKEEEKEDEEEEEEEEERGKCIIPKHAESLVNFIITESEHLRSGFKSQ